MSEIELHRKLLGDTVRNQAFHAALKALIKPGVTTVADLGAGTGFLSFLARQLGARHCTLVEYSEALELAEQLARANRIDGLSFIRSHSAQLRKPPQVDLVVSETLGNYALEEGLLETLLDARRYLKPGGALIPARLRQFVAPVGSPRLQQELDVWPGVGYGLDLSAARSVSLNNLYVKTVRAQDLAGPAQCWDDLDFAARPSSRRQQTCHWEGLEGTIHGLALWWEAELAPGITLATAPDAPATHWEQIYLPLLKPCSLGQGARLEVTLSSDTRPDVGLRVGWRTRVLHAGKAVHEQTQDSYRGRL
jgi:protein arginine N-methyltransferase 1